MEERSHRPNHLSENSARPLYRLFQLRDVLSVWSPEVYGRVRTNEEMQYGLRPQEHRQETNVDNDLSLRTLTYTTMEEIQHTMSGIPVISWKCGGEERQRRVGKRACCSSSLGYLSDCLTALPVGQKYPQAQQTEDGEHDESRKEASGLLLHKPEHERRKESPQAASRPDQSGDASD
jgi:hypothetical protein